jgi:hypothetical protein
MFDHDTKMSCLFAFTVSDDIMSAHLFQGTFLGIKIQLVCTYSDFVKSLMPTYVLAIIVANCLLLSFFKQLS